MEDSRRCDICNIDVDRATYAKVLRSQKHLENIKQDDMILQDWLFRETNENLNNIPR